MTPTEARYALAADLRTALPDDTYQVYESQPDSPPTPPAVVLVPRVSYLTKGTYCSWELRLTVHILVPLAGGTPGIDRLDELLIIVLEALEAGPVSTTVEQVNDLGPIAEAQGIQYLTASMDSVSYIT